MKLAQCYKCRKVIGAFEKTGFDFAIIIINEKFKHICLECLEGND